ncbi:hypothetical protein GGR56DRAFT_681729 [Xylariaceae sp. FL0804]|nr:hypothetical protein GGR56DRAFT_681729 [Xylariaceae sp. FL0804]
MSTIMASPVTFEGPFSGLGAFSPVKDEFGNSITIHGEDVLETVPLDDDKIGLEDPESGYSSARSCSSSPEPPQISLTDIHVKHLNEQFENMEPQDILRYCKLFFPNLYQSTAFGLSGLVTLDMLSRLQAESPSSPAVDLIFLDTLHHFPETLDLVERVRARYQYQQHSHHHHHHPGGISNSNRNSISSTAPRLHVFRPRGCATAADFAARHGERLWAAGGGDPERYDALAKVEPLRRACAALDVAALLTGRRRSQGAARGALPVVELDVESGVVKVNPLARWSFERVQEYVRENDVPYNALLDRGYKSVGDWHSTSPVAEGEGERAGRWKGQEKTECGIHNKKSRYAQFLAEMELKAEVESAAMATDAAAAPAATATPDNVMPAEPSLAGNDAVGEASLTRESSAEQPIADEAVHSETSTATGADMQAAATLTAMSEPAALRPVMAVTALVPVEQNFAFVSPQVRETPVGITTLNELDAPLSRPGIQSPLATVAAQPPWIEIDLVDVAPAYGLPEKA